MSGNGNGHPRSGLLWKIQGLLKKREAESVRDRVEELLEERGHRADDLRLDVSASGLDPHERILLGNVLRLRDKTAYDVMVPRADILAMPEDLTLDQAIKLIQREGHSRFPVYRGNLDDIVGMVHIKDVFAAVGRDPASFSLKGILRKPLLVVPQIPVLDLLLQMRAQRIHMARVVDEYGGIDGLVTIEDLVETIVGDISDEHDEVTSPTIVERPDGMIEMDARTTVEAFEQKMGPILTEEERAADIDTVGGLVFTLAGRVPARGELISHGSGVEFRVLEADTRRIRRLRVRRPGADGETPRQAAEFAGRDALLRRCGEAGRAQGGAEVCVGQIAQVEQRLIGVAREVQGGRDGWLSLLAAAAELQHGAAEARATERQKPPLHREVPPAPLALHGRGLAIDLDPPAGRVEGRDHRPWRVPPLRQGETRRIAERHPEHGREGMGIGRTAEHIDVAARHVEPERRRAGHARIEVSEALEHAARRECVFIGRPAHLSRHRAFLA